MNRKLNAAAVLTALVICGTSFAAPATADEKSDAAPSSIYDFSVRDIDGKKVALSKYKGKAVLIVNVASK